MTTLSRTVCVAALLLGLHLPAQSASGPTHLLVASEAGPGGSTQSIVHRLTGTFSSGAPAARALSTNFQLLGGFPAASDVPTAGRPWLTGVLPAFAPLLGGTTLTLHGTELNLGAALQVFVGGVAAVPGARTNATVQTTLPAQPKPGYRDLQVVAAGGDSTLPRGLGVLPLLDFPVAHQPNVPVGLRYLGAAGDQVVFALALGTTSFPFPIPGFHHALELDLGSLVVLPALPVTNPNGELVVGLPAAAPPIPIYFQAFSLTQNPGWFPGSFTNVARL